jgi:two-component system LytT family response regulator
MIRCIAIDDEPLALSQIAGYIARTPFLDLKAEFDSAIKAMSFLQENEIDLMFLDINMPDLNGPDFVKSQINPPKVVFTTAYPDYAVEGFRVSALDYLLKPIDYDIFLKSANKVLEWYRLNEIKSTRIEGNDKFLFLKSEYKILRINLSDITYIEGMREYVRVHMTGQKPVMTIISMRRIEDYLPHDRFMRVHRSFIVNLEKITTIDRNRIVFDNNVYIPVSSQYSDKFQEFLTKNFLL